MKEGGKPLRVIMNRVCGTDLEDISHCLIQSIQPARSKLEFLMSLNGFVFSSPSRLPVLGGLASLNACAALAPPPRRSSNVNGFGTVYASEELWSEPACAVA